MTDRILTFLCLHWVCSFIIFITEVQETKPHWVNFIFIITGSLDSDIHGAKADCFARAAFSWRVEAGAEWGGGVRGVWSGRVHGNIPVDWLLVSVDWLFYLRSVSFHFNRMM